MRLGRGRKPPDELGPPTVAGLMAQLATIFAAGVAHECDLDFTTDSIDRLDAYCSVWATGAPEDKLNEFIVRAGAYLGEVIVRQGAGQWVEGPAELHRTGIRLLPSTLMCFPISKVGKRITIGPEHNLRQFLQATLLQELPPEARRVPPPDRA